MSEQQAPAVEISDEELRSLTQAIQQRHGIDFTCYEPKSLKRRVMRALTVFKFQSVHELWIKILRDRAFIYSFMDEISVGLTAMFRDPVLWRKMKQLLQTEYSSQSELVLWHAGCSTGEEVYTMGIVLKESGYKGNVKAHATDISKQSMETAKRGEYHSMKLPEYETNLKAYNSLSDLRRYYQDAGDSVVRMNADLIKHVVFSYQNLITDPFPGKFDVIFCRNVMIYFDNGAKLKLFQRFHDALQPGGLLVIGFYDAVLPLMDENKFKILDIDAKIFRKVG
jgi:chemotaxis protein methyltransferase CheR